MTLYYYQQQRLTGGPGMTGAYTPRVQRKMSAMEKMTRQQQRIVTHLINDNPDLQFEDPELNSALMQQQQAYNWGTPEERDDANFNLFKTFRKGVGTGLQGLVWLSRQFERLQRSWVTPLVLLGDQAYLHTQAAGEGLTWDEKQHMQHILRLYDDDPDQAQALYEGLGNDNPIRRVIDSIPENTRATAGMNIFEAAWKGLQLDPDTLNIQTAVMGDPNDPRFGTTDRWGIRLPGVTNAALRTAYGIGLEFLDPIVWLRGPGGAAMGMARYLPQAGKAALSGERVAQMIKEGRAANKGWAQIQDEIRAAQKAATKVRQPIKAQVIQRGKPRQRILAPEGTKEYVEYHRTIAGAVRRKQIRLMKAQKARFPGKTDSMKAIQEEAYIVGQEAGDLHAGLHLGKLAQEAKDGYGKWLDPGSLYWAPPFIKPVMLAKNMPLTAPLRNAFRAVSAVSPTARKAVEKGWDAIDAVFNEVRRKARMGGRYPRILATQRAKAARDAMAISEYLQKTYGDIAVKDREVIGKYMWLRSSERPEAQALAAQYFQAIPVEHRDIPRQLDHMLSRPFFDEEIRNGSIVSYREGYFPGRYKNDPSDWEMISAHLSADPTNKYAAIKSRLGDDPTFSFERAFEDFQEALDFVKDSKLDIEIQPIYDFVEAFKIRGFEHANEVAQKKAMRTVSKWYGVKATDVNRMVFNDVHPELMARIEAEVAAMGDRIPFFHTPSEALDNLPSYYAPFPERLRPFVANAHDLMGEVVTFANGRGGFFRYQPHPILARGFMEFLDQVRTSPLFRRKDGTPAMRFNLSRDPEAQMFTRRALDEAGYKHLSENVYYEVAGQTRLAADGTWEAVLGPSADQSTVLEEIVHILQKSGHEQSLEIIDPTLNKWIKKWEIATRKAALDKGFDIPGGEELFAKAYVIHKIGFVDDLNPLDSIRDKEIQELIKLPKKIADRMDSIFAKETGQHPIDAMKLGVRSHRPTKPEELGGMMKVAGMKPGGGLRLGEAPGPGATRIPQVPPARGPTDEFGYSMQLKPLRGWDQATKDRFDSYTHQVAGLKAMRRYVTPEVARSTRIDSAKRLVELFSEEKAQQLASVGFAGRAAKGWYQTSGEVIKEIFGEQDGARFAALLAALSPQRQVKINLRDAVRFWSRWIKLDDSVRYTPEAIGKLHDELITYLPSVSRDNVIEALTAADPFAARLLSGPKVQEFRRNLMGDMKSVTLDTWMAKIFGVSQTAYKKSVHAPAYAAHSAIIRRAAEILTKRTGERWTPAEVQETVWTWAKVLQAKKDKAGETRSLLEILKAGDMTMQDIADEPDFGILLTQGIFRKILGEAGYEKRLGRVAARGGRVDRGYARGLGETSGKGSQSTLRDQRHLEQLASELGEPDLPYQLKPAAGASIRRLSQEQAVGQALNHFWEMSERIAEMAKKPGVRWSKDPSVKRDVRKFHRFLDALPEYDRAHALVGAARIIGETQNLAQFAHFIDTFRGPINSVTNLTLQSVRKRVTSARRDVLTDIFGEPWRKVTANPGEPFYGMYLPKAIWEDIHSRSLPSPPKMANILWGLKVLDFMTDMTKFGLTSPWPAFHTRNAYSNVAQAFIDIGWSAVNPAKHALATRIINGHDGFVEILGKQVPLQRIRLEAEEYGAVRVARHMMDYQDAEGAMRSRWRGIMAGEDVPLKVGRREVKIPVVTTGGLPIPGTKAKMHPARFGNWIENEARMMLFLHYRMSGHTPSAASAAVDNVFFDYLSLSGADKGVFKRIFPFWVWNKKNIALNVRQLKSQPGRMIAMTKISSQFVPTTPEEFGPDEVFLPDYMTGAMRVGWKSEGKTHFLTGVDFPFTSALELVWPQELAQTFKNWVSMSHPARTLLDVYGYGHDPFTGADVSPDARRRMKGMGDFIRTLKNYVPGGDRFAKFMEYQERVDPETGETFHTVNAAKYHLLMKGSMLSRMTGTGDRLRRYVDGEGVDVTNMLLDLLGGFQIRDYNLTRQQMEMVKANLRYLETYGVRKGSRYEFRISAPTKRIKQGVAG